MRNFLLGMFAMYMATALLFATSMAFDGPKAMNPFGLAYYGLLWPAWPISSIAGTLVVPIPTWAFSFNSNVS